MPSVYAGWKNAAGLVCFCAGRWAFHLAIQRRHWVWGHEQDWYDGPIDSWGLGPVFLVSNYWR